jgi:hypothetical protein
MPEYVERVQKITPLHPGRAAKRLQPVSWLADRLAMDNLDQAYSAIRSRHIPPECVVRIGRNIRINPEAVEAWIARGDQSQEAN